ncbi:MAG: hypothetical protein MW690_000973 [Methanophagales archaeon]|nr:hypothetical protein [Methanophagales archaeon]MCU4140498.1 hypothetical protein [Methanophagales archaeon]
MNEEVKKEEGEEREMETMWNESFAVNGSNTVDVHSSGNDERRQISYLLSLKSSIYAPFYAKKFQESYAFAV